MNLLLFYTTINLLFFHNFFGIEAKLPTIIKPCSRKLQNINGCIIDSINILRPNLVSGNLGEDFEIPKLDPLSIDEIKISNGNDLQANFKNLSVFGPSNFTLLNLDTNIGQMSFSFDLELPNLEFTGDYSIALKVLIKLTGNGKLQGIFKNCHTHVSATGKLTDEFNHVEFQLKVKMKVSYAQFQLENLFDNDSFLNKIGNRVINDNYELFLNELVPGLEDSLGKIFSRIVNNILKNSTYNEMFPEN